MMTRVTAAVFPILLLLLMMTSGCQEAAESPTLPVAKPANVSRPAHEGRPPLPLLPSVQEGQIQTAIEVGNNTRVIDENLHVWYIPCEPLPFTPVAPIILTDLHSGSIIYLNRDGAARDSPQPEFMTDEGRARLESVLKDRTMMEQVLTFPECP